MTEEEILQFQKKFTIRLLSLLREVADFSCTYLGVKYKSFSEMKPNDSCYKGKDKAAAYCDSRGNIRIKIKHHRTKEFFEYDYLIDSVVHEVVHLVHDRHDKNFRKEYRRLLGKVREVFA